MRFAHSFDDASAPTRKEARYYEMIASRAIWAGGWKAVVEQPQGDTMTDEMLARQKWELYHVENDFSECENLADKHPEKLAELVERWWIEAGKYNVLPLHRYASANYSGIVSASTASRIYRSARSGHWPWFSLD